MRKFLSLILALIMLMSFSIIAYAGNGDGTGGGTGEGDDEEWDGIPGTLSFVVTTSSNSYPIDKVVLPFEMTTSEGGLKHADTSNMSETINNKTVTLTSDSGVVSGFNAVPSNVVCYGDKTKAYFDIAIDKSLLSVGGTYTLTIKSGATWANKPKNTATLESDFSYTFTVVEGTVEVETTTAASKQVSPLVTEVFEETTTEIASETTTAAIVAASETTQDDGSSTTIVIMLGASSAVLGALCVLRKKMVF